MSNVEYKILGKDLSVIVVNYKSARFIHKCLSTIYENTKDINFEIIVIDNASYDDCESIIRNEFPEAIFIQSDQNIGFANANNLGFNNSSGEVLLFMNPDTEIVGTAINKMYTHLLSIENAGAIGCKLLNSDLSLQTSCVQPFPTIINQLLDVDVIKGLLPDIKLWGMKPLFKNIAQPEPVEVISGACLMIKRDVFEKIGFFSTDYFMYTEDIDLCFKVKCIEKKVYYTNDGSVIHHGGGSSQSNKDNRFSDVLMRESIWTFIYKNNGMVFALLYKLTMSVSAFIRLILLWGLVLIGYRRGDTVKLHKSIRKWKNILRWGLGFEGWSRDLNQKAKVSS